MNHIEYDNCLDDQYRSFLAGNAQKYVHTYTFLSFVPIPAQGMGYAGISNALAVEFDTHYNPDQLEPYQNHVSVQTR